MAKRVVMEKQQQPRLYTDEEIRELKLTQLNEFARKLEWRAPRYDYYSRSTGTDLRAYRTTGFPTRYAGARIGSREEFLRLRLLKTSQKKWNPEAMEAIAKKEADEEAKKPKVSVDVQTNVVIRLKDWRPKGHTFVLSRKDNKVFARQEPYSKGNGQGRPVCRQQGVWNTEDFENAIRMLSEVDIPESRKETKGAVSLDYNVRLVLRGTNNLLLKKKGNIVFICEEPETVRNDDDYWWQFRESDLIEVVAAVKKNYQVRVVEETVAERDARIDRRLAKTVRPRVETEEQWLARNESS